MTEKELRKLKRRDMLEIMLAQSREIDRLRGELAEAEKKLADRDLKVEKCGDLAEAALAVTGIFEEARKAAEIYLHNVYLSVNRGDADNKDNLQAGDPVNESPKEDLAAADSDEAKSELSTEGEDKVEAEDSVGVIISENEAESDAEDQEEETLTEENSGYVTDTRDIEKIDNSHMEADSPEPADAGEGEEAERSGDE